MALEIEVDSSRCNGSAACVRLAPGVFHLDRGVALVIDPEAAPEAAVVTAARECPTAAIIVRADGEQLV